MAIITYLGLRADLDAYKNDGSQRVALFTNDLVITPNTVLADLVLATFSGYGRTVPLFGVSATGGDGKARCTSDGQLFQHNGGPVQNLVKGWALHYINGPLIAAELLPVPKLFVTGADFLVITLVRSHGQG